ncbi:transposase [Nonomuraea sp. NPDC050153]|uniref:transposase n=1 Tax=Nonomuraea sp. NPDC050153 TaxID=3364359 RepID=UPI0037A36DE8
MLATTISTHSGDGEETTVRPGHRNGHCPTSVKTTSARPKLRGTTETFVSRLFGTGVTRTHALETLVIASFVRGLSVRDVEGALADVLGPEAAPEQVDGLDHLPGHRHRVRRLVPARPDEHRAGLPVPGRLAFQNA